MDGRRGTRLDYGRDGALDLMVIVANGQFRICENERTTDGVIQVRVLGPTSPRHSVWGNSGGD